MKDLMTEAAEAAGQIIKKHYGSFLDIESKGDKGIVTQADKESEEKILSILRRETDYSVIAEESGSVQRDSEYSWVIDPIDGTTNFSRKIPFFCTSIALLKNGIPEAGVVFNPLTDEMFYGEKNKGAFLNDRKLLNIQANTPPLISYNKGYQKKAFKEWLKGIEKIFLTETNEFLVDGSDIRLPGASALELSYLADGRFDCFLTYGDELYDVAAGVIIVQEAGCKVSDWKGNQWTKGNVDLLAAPPALHKEIIRKLSLK